MGPSWGIPCLQGLDLAGFDKFSLEKIGFLTSNPKKGGFMQINIKIDNIDAIKKMFPPRVVNSIIRDTTKEVANRVRTKISQEIRKRYSLPAARIKEGIQVQNSFSNDGSVNIRFTGRTPGLQNYAMRVVRVSAGGTVLRGKSTKQRTYKGVTVEVIRGQRKLVQGAFYLRPQRGGEGIFRATKDRKLHRLFGPSLRGMYRATKADIIAKQTAAQVAQTAFDRSVRKYIYKRS